MRSLARAVAICAIALFTVHPAGADDTSGDPGASQPAKSRSDGGRKRADAERVKHLDTNGDGVVSDAERAAFEQKRQELLAKYDADHDGTLDEEEIEAARDDGALRERKSHDRELGSALRKKP